MPRIPELPEPLATLLTKNSTKCRHFRRNIQKYNCALCLASLQATFSSGPSVYKVQDEVYRFNGPLRPANWEQRNCLQRSLSMLQCSRRFGALDLTIIKDLTTTLESCSSYIQSFITIDKQLQVGLLPQSVSLELLADVQPIGLNDTSIIKFCVQNGQTANVVYTEMLSKKY